MILAHNYMTPEIFHGVGDFVGDSLGLAREAARTDARIIVQAGVHFMAETSKVLCPEKTVLIPDLRAGCSLAASITAADVRLIKERYPGVPVVTYVNTTAEVKAETDVCCTSANAVQVVEAAAAAAGTTQVILLPDEFLARNVARQTDIRIIAWQGRCEVHERFDADDIRAVRESWPDAVILAHPECPAEVLEAGRLRRLDHRDERLCGEAPAAPGGAGDRVLDGRQHRRRRAGHRVRAALQPLPAHEAHQPRGHPRGAGERSSTR